MNPHGNKHVFDSELARTFANDFSKSSLIEIAQHCDRAKRALRKYEPSAKADVKVYEYAEIALWHIIDNID